MNKPSSPAQWLAHCKTFGWTVTKNGGIDTAVSPRNTKIIYDSKRRLFISGSIESPDFVRLVNLLIDDFGKATHTHRTELLNSKLDTKELFALLDICQPTEDKTVFDSWRPTGEGKLGLDYTIGPLVVSGTINEDYSWVVSMTDGGPCDRTETGKSADFLTARQDINERLLTWTDEVICTGKFALKLNSRIRGVIE